MLTKISNRTFFNRETQTSITYSVFKGVGVWLVVETTVRNGDPRPVVHPRELLTERAMMLFLTDIYSTQMTRGFKEIK